MEFFRRRRPAGSAVALFPGAFNPPTRAHLALASAALTHAEEVVFALPRSFPHKPFEGPDFEQRLELLLAVTASEERFSVAAASHGLLIDIARACRQVIPSDTRLLFVCGSDAARRFIEWDYGEPGAFARQLQEYELLVAPRGEPFVVPVGFDQRIHLLDLPPEYANVSSSGARTTRQWHDVPAEIAPRMDDLYRA